MFTEALAQTLTPQGQGHTSHESQKQGSKQQPQEIPHPPLHPKCALILPERLPPIPQPDGA
jgi:hypothetical protein